MPTRPLRPARRPRGRPPTPTLRAPCATTSWDAPGPSTSSSCSFGARRPRVSGAVEALHIPVAAAVPAVGALELGGIVVLANADVRRRSRRGGPPRSAGAGPPRSRPGAVAFNWLAHANHPARRVLSQGIVRAGLPGLAHAHREPSGVTGCASRATYRPTSPGLRDGGALAAPPVADPAGQGRWPRADPRLGALRVAGRRARARCAASAGQAAISKVLHRKIRSAVDPKDRGTFAISRLRPRRGSPPGWPTARTTYGAHRADRGRPGARSRLRARPGDPRSVRPSRRSRRRGRPTGRRPQPQPAEPLFPPDLRRDPSHRRCRRPRAANDQVRRERTRRQSMTRATQPALPVGPPRTPGRVPVRRPVAAPVSPAPAGFDQSPRHRPPKARCDAGCNGETARDALGTGRRRAATRAA